MVVIVIVIVIVVAAIIVIVAGGYISVLTLTSILILIHETTCIINSQPMPLSCELMK